MDIKNFEQTLLHMSKPEVTSLKHEEMLAKAILNAKDKSVLSWWWLAIPLYLIAAFTMKTIFLKGSTLISNIHEFASENKYSSPLLFLVLPIIFIVINFLSAKQIYFLSGNPKEFKFLQAIWFNALIIFLSIIIIIIYLL